jgi:monothiol glutaredoxin
MSDNPVFDRIKAEIDASPVTVFMKGTAVFPQCGFSARVVQILSHLNVPFKSVNVLEDAEIREGIKEYANWPTIPQLYVNGEFVGGCDIVMEMFQAGELQSIPSALRFNAKRFASSHPDKSLAQPHWHQPSRSVHMWCRRSWATQHHGVE